MPETLVDLRCLQDGDDPAARAVLEAAPRGATLTGLLDARRPPLPGWARARLDETRCFAGAPSRLAQLSPSHDPLPVARLLLRGTPSITLPLPARARAPDAAGRISWALAEHWQARYGRIMPATDPDAFWSALAALPDAEPVSTGTVALLDPAPSPGLIAALQTRVALHAYRGPRSALPFLSPRFDHVVSDRPARYGGAWLLSRELPDPHAEASAEHLLTYSPALARTIERRSGRPVSLLPRPVSPVPHAHIRASDADPVLASVITGWGAEHCIWALDMLRFWGIPARLHLIGPAAADWPRLHALAKSLDLSGRIALIPASRAAPHWQQADLGLMLAPASEPEPVEALHAAAAAGLRCIATRAVAAAIPAPSWVSTVPDAPSPVLLAEAILGALDGPPPPASAVLAYAARHTPERTASALCDALAL